MPTNVKNIPRSSEETTKGTISYRRASVAVYHTGLVFYKKVVALNYGGIKCWMLFLFSANLYYSSTSPYLKTLTPSVRSANILHSHAFSGNSQTFMSTVFLIRGESTKLSSWTHSCVWPVWSLALGLILHAPAFTLACSKFFTVSHPL